MRGSKEGGGAGCHGERPGKGRPEGDGEGEKVGRGGEKGGGGGKGTYTCITV